MTTENAVFDDLLWTAARYSQVLGIDIREITKRLAKTPHHQIGARKVWDIRDVLQLKGRRDPHVMEPKDALDYYRGQRERLKLAVENGEMIPAADVEQTISNAFKSLAQSLESLPDALERDCGLPPLAVIAMQPVCDAAREAMFENLVAALGKLAESE